MSNPSWKRLSKKTRAKRILMALTAAYPNDDRCHLDYGTPWQLLVATILSAQCTDARVNQVTPGLFARYPSVSDMAGADVAELEALVQSCGFYRTKAAHILEAARLVCARHGGELPKTIEELTALPGVGRKTANVIRGNVYGEPAVVVDTHVGRVSRRLGLIEATDPEKAEYELMGVLPKAGWITYNHVVIAHGRAVCKAPTARCERCGLLDLCERRGI